MRARNGNDKKLINDEEAVDALLVNSIKAKLMVLDMDPSTSHPQSKQPKINRNSDDIKKKNLKGRLRPKSEKESENSDQNYYDDDE